MYDYETRRMCQGIEREMELARALRLARLGLQPAELQLNVWGTLRALWRRRPHLAAVLRGQRAAS